MTLLALLLGALFLVQLTVSDKLVDDVRNRKIIWVRRQTKRWREMIRDMDFACELYVLQLEHQCEQR